MKYRSRSGPCFIYVVTAYMECIMLYSVIWAGFNGFSDGGMEYTRRGEALSAILICILPLLSLVVLLTCLGRLYKDRDSIQVYAYEILLWLVGAGIGVIIYMVMADLGLSLQQTIQSGVMHEIREAGWLQYPLP